MDPSIFIYLPIVATLVVKVDSVAVFNVVVGVVVVVVVGVVVVVVVVVAVEVVLGSKYNQ